ncbi:unnamed protein product [Rotaria sp. Silwood2]|nr:unnamed protein product [Rotaria sp. Silwood2]CAF4323529.1 unnamed protein product [Rotaria sp. Silwood2]
MRKTNEIFHFDYYQLRNDYNAESLFAASDYNRTIFKSTDNQQQQNTMDSSGLIHLIATRGETNVTDNTNNESIVNIRTDDQTSEQAHEQLRDENLPEDQHEQVPLLDILAKLIYFIRESFFLIDILFTGAEDGGTVSTDKIDALRKPAL